MMFKTRFQFIWLILVIAMVSLFSACGEKDPDPRSSDDIFQERVNLPALYFTGKTHRRVEAPGSKGTHVDEKTGEICWPAFACQNPNCPGKGKDGGPFLFSVVDPAVFIEPDGTMGYDQSKMSRDKTLGFCPKCLKIRDLKTESKEALQRYVNWVGPHVLPETAKRMKELDEEGKRRSEQKK